LQQITPARGFLALLATQFSSPDLSAEARIIVHQSDAGATLRRSHRRRNAGWASTHHENTEMPLRIAIHQFLRPCPFHKQSGNSGNAAFH
jgi:hypothetical protein